MGLPQLVGQQNMIKGCFAVNMPSGLGQLDIVQYTSFYKF